MHSAESSNIAVYNRHVQYWTSVGHASIRPFSGGFRAVGSTSSVAARDNTCTTGTGVPIHWLNGNKVADNYGDFYDGDWDDNNLKNQHGNLTNLVISVPVWTGSASDGTIPSNSSVIWVLVPRR